MSWHTSYLNQICIFLQQQRPHIGLQNCFLVVYFLFCNISYFAVFFVVLFLLCNFLLSLISYLL